MVGCILRLLYNAGTIFYMKKYNFFAQTIDYLGYSTWCRRLELAQYNTGSVTKLGILNKQTRHRSILSSHNVFRWFVLNFARLTAPLDQDLGGAQPENLGPRLGKRTIA